jgi:hypothetical protein
MAAMEGRKTERVSLRPSTLKPLEAGSRDERPAKKEPFLQKLRGRRSREYFLLFLAAAVIIEGLHVLEHVVQSLQVFAFGVSPAVAGGLAGSLFDFPWVHFAYNFLFFGALIFAVAWAYGLGGFSRFDSVGMWALIIVAGIQTYHAAEHVIQIAQTFETGTARPPGFIGFFAAPVGGNVAVHLALNLIVWVPTVIAFYRFGGAQVFTTWLASVRQARAARA